MQYNILRPLKIGFFSFNKGSKRIEIFATIIIITFTDLLNKYLFIPINLIRVILRFEI